MRALALAHETGDIVMVARAENLLGDIEHSVGNMDAARKHFARGVEGFRALAPPVGPREFADRDGGGRPRDWRRRARRAPPR